MIGLNQDLLIILLIAGIIFGSKKLPEIGKGLGQSIKEFKDGLSGQEGETLFKPKEIEKDTSDKKN